MSDATDQALHDHQDPPTRTICIWRHSDGSICGHLPGTYQNIHGPTDYKDIPGSLGRALREWQGVDPRKRGVRHQWTPGTPVPVLSPARAAVVPGQLSIVEAP